MTQSLGFNNVQEIELSNLVTGMLYGMWEAQKGNQEMYKKWSKTYEMTKLVLINDEHAYLLLNMGTNHNPSLLDKKHVKFITKALTRSLKKKNISSKHFQFFTNILNQQILELKRD